MNIYLYILKPFVTHKNTIMEQYVDKFKAYVLNFLKKEAKERNLKINQTSLGFYIGEISSETEELKEKEYGVGFILSQGVPIENYVVTTILDGDRCFLQVSLNTSTNEYEYEWSFHAINAACYGSEDAAQKVIEMINIEADTMFVGNADDVASWRKSFPKDYEKTDDVEFKHLAYPQFSQILNLIADPLHLGDIVPPMIYQSLLKTAEHYGIEMLDLRIYVIPYKNGEDVSVHIFNGEDYLAEGSLYKLMFPSILS